MTPGLMIAALMLCPPVDPDDLPERLTVAPVAKAEAANPAKPVGKWVRDVEMARFTFAFTENRATFGLAFTPPEEMKNQMPAFVLSLDADYSVSPDGLIYGVFSGGDGEPACIGATAQILAGHAFSLRARVENGMMTVRDVKFFGATFPIPMTGAKPPEPKGIQDMTLAEAVQASVGSIGGRYLTDDGTRKPKKPAKAEAVAPAGAYSEAPVQVMTPVPTAPPPVMPSPTAPPPMMPSPTTPPMVGHLPPLVGTPTVAPQGQTWPKSVPPLPQTFQAPTPPPLLESTLPRVTLAASSMPMLPPPVEPAKQIVVKKADGYTIRLTFAGKRLYAELREATDMGGKRIDQVFTFDADIATGSDGMTFGVVTGVDVVQAPGNSGTDFVKRLSGAMFKFRMREENGTTAVRDLTLTGGETSDKLPEALAGKYTPATSDKVDPPAVAIPPVHVEGRGPVR